MNNNSLFRMVYGWIERKKERERERERERMMRERSY